MKSRSKFNMSGDDGAIRADVDAAVRQSFQLLFTPASSTSGGAGARRALRLLGAVAMATALSASAQFQITSFTGAGGCTVSNTFTNGVCTLWQAEAVNGAYRPVKSVFTTSSVAEVSLCVTGANGFIRAQASDLSGGRTGFSALTGAYGLLTTLAGNGNGPQDYNNWQANFEGKPATRVALSGPHIALADRAGFVYIADKDAHGIRKILHDGTLITVAGINAPGNGGNEEMVATNCAMNQPNGLWVRGDGTAFIYDMQNGKVRRLDTNGMIRTLIDGGGYMGGRGLWVSDDESVAYLSGFTVVRKWTPGSGLTEYSTGYTELGNMVVDPGGNLVVADRGANRVYRLDSQGNKSVIAGNGTAIAAADGTLATEAGLYEVRGVWFVPSGAYFLATHKGSQVWYVNTEGRIYLFLHGNRYGAHAGDGSWFYNWANLNPIEPRLSKCRAVTGDYEGNLLITENDYGYVRKVRFLPYEP